MLSFVSKCWTCEVQHFGDYGKYEKKRLAGCQSGELDNAGAIPVVVPQ